MDKRLGGLIAAHYGVHLRFPSVDLDRVARVRGKSRSRQELTGLDKRLPSKDPVEGRYRLEYEQDIYHSYKPGIDDGLDEILGYPLESACVVELGGGPSYLARQGGTGNLPGLGGAPGAGAARRAILSCRHLLF